MFPKPLYSILLSSIIIAHSGISTVDASEDGMVDDGVVAGLILSNPSEFQRPDENTIVSFDRLGLKVADAGSLAVVEGGNVLPSQLIDFNGDGAPDSMVFTAGFDSAETKEFQVLSSGDTSAVFPKRTQAEISIKQGGAWEGSKYIGGKFENVREITPPPAYTDHSEYIRYEGPGIESDRVGYRIYLDWRNGFDIFGKKTTEMVLQDVGQDGYQSYHEMADWGMDVLKVGDAAGMGGYGFWDGEKLHRVADVQQRSVSILDNGPIYSQLEILYEGWKVGGEETDLSARLAMQAGSHLVHTRLAMSEELDNIAVGIVKHPGTQLLQGTLETSTHSWVWVASWGKQSLNDDHLGMVLLFKRGHRSIQTEDEHNYVSVLGPRNGHVEYYFGAVWEGEPGNISTEAEFIALLEKEAEKLTMPLRQQLKTKKSVAELSQAIDSARALEWSERLGASEIARLGDSLHYEGFDPVSKRDAQWTYTNGLLSQALDDLSDASEDKSFAAWARANIDSYITDEGGIRTYEVDEYNIDKINSGKMLLRLYEQTGEEKYRIAASHLRAQLADHPRTSEGAFWHKKRYPYQLWLDGVYMGMPFLAQYSVMEEDEEGLAEAVNEFVISRRHLRDPETGLYYHAWDEKKQQVWADPGTGLSRYFWSRGMGWYAMALVDILDFIPEERGDLRDPLVENITELADVLLKYRNDKGWLQITNMPDAPGNYPEASGSSMFVYMLAKAVNKGYLGNEYRQVAADAYTDLVRHFLNVEASGNVSLENVCAVAGLGFGRDGSYGYYMGEPIISNDPKGTAPFIMAGIQVSRMLD